METQLLRKVRPLSRRLERLRASSFSLGVIKDRRDREVSKSEEQRVLDVEGIKVERPEWDGLDMHRGQRRGSEDQWRREVAGKEVKRRLMDVVEEGMKLVREKTRQRMVEIDGGRLIDGLSVDIAEQAQKIKKRTAVNSLHHLP